MQTTSGVSAIIGMGTEFVTGFVGMLGDTIDAFMDESMLMFFVFAIPIGMLVFKSVKGFISKRKG